MTGNIIPIWELIFKWAVSQEVTGVLQWIGTLIAVIGIPLAIRQARRAANAAEEARQAVTHFQQRLTSVNVAHAYSQLELVKGLVHNNNYSAAISVVGILKRSVLQSIEVLKSLESVPQSISQGRRNVALIESQLSLAARSASTFNVSVLDGAMRGLGDCLIQWEQLVIQQGSGHG